MVSRIRCSNASRCRKRAGEREETDYESMCDMIRWPQRTREASTRVPSVATDQERLINEHGIVDRIIKALGLFGKLEATVACFSTDVHFFMAFGAFLLVPVLRLLFAPEILLCFCFFFGLEPLCTRCIGLYHTALRMDAIR